MAEIRWGIMGTGAVANLFSEGLAFAPGARLVAVGSRSKGRAETFAARFAVPHAHPSYEEVARDPEVDVVYVATENHLHEEHALLAIDAGKAVLCEKPFALGAASAARVVAAARRRGVFCMEAMWMRFSPAFREALAVVRGGGLGQIHTIVAQLGFPHRFDPQDRLFSPVGGGALLDLGVYGLSLVQAIVGTSSPLQRVDAQAVVGATGVDEQVIAVLRFGQDCLATVAASLRCQLTAEATVHGAEGMLRLGPLYFPDRYGITKTPSHAGAREGRRGALARLRLHPWVGAIAELRRRRRTRQVVRRAAGNGYQAEAIEVMRCLREGLLESPVMSLDASVAVTELADAIRRRFGDGR